MQFFVRAIDSLSAWTGERLKWIAVCLVCVAAFEVVMRYVFNRPTQWGYETLLMLGCSMYALSWAYVDQVEGHIRVDVITSRLTERTRRLIDSCCTLLVFYPVVGALIYVSAKRMWYSWEVAEKSTETTWYPPMWPVRAAVFLGFSLFALQRTAGLVRDLRLLVGRIDHE